VIYDKKIFKFNCSEKHLQWFCKQAEIARKLSKEWIQRNTKKKFHKKMSHNFIKKNQEKVPEQDVSFKRGNSSS